MPPVCPPGGGRFYAEPVSEQAGHSCAGGDGQEGPPAAIPVSVGALIFDSVGRLLILKPTYKKGWTIPGGVMEPTGESPWQACRREVAEECGLEPTAGRLVAVDTRPATLGRPPRLRLLFHCGTWDDATLSRIEVCRYEISDHQLLPPDEALELLRPPIRRRVASTLAALASPGPTGCCYLEDGLPVPGVSS